MDSDYWVRVRAGDAPPGGAPRETGAPQWVRATITTPAAKRPDPDDFEGRTTWLVDSFDLVVPRYPWQRD